ncbi:MAG: DNA polymerase domain-containing protein [Candidatus Poseidoniaceae archaeon]|nr:DNA polymerase domain-containing protein [Candidatus Poseidoniaceae archaeon]
MASERWEGRVGLISSRYRSIGEGSEGTTVVELFGRAASGESVCLLVHGLRPHIEVAPIGRWSSGLEVPEALLESATRLRERDQVRRVTGPELRWTDLGWKPVWRVEVHQPFMVPELRRALEGAWSLFAADIPFTNRLLLEADLGMHVEVTGEIVARRVDGEDAEAAVRKAGGGGVYAVDLTIRCSVEEVQPTEAFPVPFRLLSFDLETSIADNSILCGAAVLEDLGTGAREVHSWRDDETALLEGLTELILDRDPDIITGYNIDNFDLPRIAERVEALGGRKDAERRLAMFGWGRTPQDASDLRRQRESVVPKRASTRAWTLGGRCVMDAWWQARMALRPQRETLAFVSALLFPEDAERQKMDVDASRMDEEWAARPDVVLEYCRRDAELPLDILQALQIVRRKEAVAAVAKVAFETASNGSTSQLIDSLVIRRADRTGIAVPMTGSAEPKEGQITGGYVHDVEAGLHPWIAVLDFKSMYPSIMIGHNICYTTRVDPAHPEQPAEDQEVHTAPTGVRFWGEGHRTGLVPFLLRDLMEQRDRHKQGMKDAEAEAEHAFHDAMQYAVKILMNSFYGVFASGFYRFTHRDLGSSITAWARHNIKAVIADLEAQGHPVVYSDTDSIFVKSPIEGSVPGAVPTQARLDAASGDKEAEKVVLQWDQAKDAMVTFGLDLAEKYSRDAAVLEFEKGLSVFFSHGAKKRYVGQVVWPNEDMLIRGYETQRTDSFAFLVESMHTVMGHALADEGDDLVAYALEQVAALKERRIEANRLILAKSCKGKVRRDGTVDFASAYANPDSMAQVRAAKQRIALGLPFTSGMKVSFVVTDASRRPMQVAAWLEEQDEGGVDGYDGRFYAERLAAALGRITEAFGWTAQDLIRGSRQTSLFSF